MADLYRFAVTLIAVGFGFLHRWHVSTLFENDRHFSHLSEIEREMSFRTEMGMYYSYYKMIAESPTFMDGLSRIKHDNLSQYGNPIDAGRKYRLLPEKVAGFLYHSAKSLGLVSVGQCWQVERGDSLPPITSCEGLGVPVHFYLEIVWISTVFTVAILFYYSTYLGNSVASGFITVLLFFYNHNECTRVQWTPPLRESFAYPMLLFQMYKTTVILREYAKNPEKMVSMRVLAILGFSVAICLCSWQFSYFVFVTQIIALLGLKWMGIITNQLYLAFCTSHGWGALAVSGMFDGDIFRYSVYTSLLMISSTVSFLGNISWLNKKLETGLEIGLTALLMLIVNIYMLTPEDDAHVFSLLRAKLFGYKDFHTMLYTCSAEFDFLQYRTYEAIVRTLLLPTSILAGILALYFWYRNYKTRGYPLCIEPEMAYNGLQTGAFTVLAVLIMRLKLFMNPHMCIIAGTVCARRYLEKVGLRGELTRGAILALLIAGMSYHGIERLQEERAIIGEFSDMEQEELFEWITSNTSENAVFAGKMSLMANLMLSTKRPIVNNPYYESKEMRDRTMKVYEIFSRKDAVSVYNTLRSLQVGYVVLEEPLCLGFVHLKPGCQMVDLWDTVDNGTAKAAGKPALCPILFQGNAYPFKRVFANSHYVVLQLDYTLYVEFKPKTSEPLHYQI